MYSIGGMSWRGRLSVAALLIMGTTGASATLTYSIDNSSPFASEASFLAGLDASTTEDFDSLTLSSSLSYQGTGVSTSVGTFKVDGSNGSSSGACMMGCDELMVLNAHDSPFQGRFDTTDGDRGDGNSHPGQWLDSNDVTSLSWTIGGSLPGANAFGFYVSDLADQGATMAVTYDDGSQAETILSQSGLGNGDLFYVSAISDMSIISASVTFANTNGHDQDGFGIDDVTIGRASVPEPASLGLLGAGLLGLGFRRRNRGRKSR